MSQGTYLAMIASVIALTAGAADAQIFQDGTFADASWSITTLAMKGGVACKGSCVSQGGSVGGTYVASGGNPLAYRRVQHGIEAQTNGIETYLFSFHRFLAGTYDPAALGAVPPLCYSEDSIRFSTLNQSTGPAIRQDDIVYIHRGSPSLLTTPAWTTQTRSNLIATDFDAIAQCGTSCTASNFIDGTLHPDFSGTGSPIEFGFYRGNSTYTDFSTDAGIDNWTFGSCAALSLPRCEFDHCKATKIATSMVRAFSECVPPGNGTTVGEEDSCAPPVPLSLYKFRPFCASKCKVTIGAKVRTSCANPPCCCITVSTSCGDILDSTGVQADSVLFKTSMTLRITQNDPLGGDMTAVDKQFHFASAVSRGKLKRKSGCLEPDGEGSIPACSAAELIDLVITDPDDNPFAVPGVSCCQK
jgi:hypothetical protein